MANPIRFFPCPACSHPLSMSTSRMVTSTTREQYANCGNVHCGASFLIRSEIVNLLSPPADLFAEKTKHIPAFKEARQRALDLAIMFLNRDWQSHLSDDEKLIACRDYVMETENISMDSATLLTNVALAEIDSKGLHEWSVAVEHHNTGVIVNQGMNKQHVVPLRKIVNLIQENKPVSLLEE